MYSQVSNQFPYHGTYSSIETYWATVAEYPRIEYLDGFRQWFLCKEQVYVELWTEVWGDSDNLSNNITVLSW